MLAVVFRRIAHQCRICLEEVVVLLKADNFRALRSFNQNLDGPIRKFQQLKNGSNRTNRIDIVGCRIVVSGVLLGNKQYLLVVFHNIFKSARTDFSRPTNNGTIICGKTTISRRGRTGKLRRCSDSDMLPLTRMSVRGNETEQFYNIGY